MTRPVRTSLVALVVAATLPPGAARAQTSSGGDPASTEGALFLILPVGAKAVALSRSMTARRGPESVFWNPAGLATLERSQLVLLHDEFFAGPATAASALFAKPGLGTLGATYFLLDVGDQDVTDTDNNIVGRNTVRQHLAVASAAAQLARGVVAGVNLAYIQYRIGCRGDCLGAGTDEATYAVDFGMQANLSDNLRVGGLVAHLGPDLRSSSGEADPHPLPARMRFGVAYDIVSALVGNDQLGGSVSIEVQDHLRDPGTLSAFFGMELAAGATDAIFLRAGYGLGDIPIDEGASVGLGLRYQRFDLALAKSLSVTTIAVETEPIHVTFAYVF